MRNHAAKIRDFIASDITTIGVNNMNGLFIPDYHLFASAKRYKKYWRKVHPKSRLLLAAKIKPHHRKFDIIPFKNKYPSSKGKMKVTTKIRCEGATGGTLAAGYAVLKGAKEIYFVGMDGYSKGSKHFYKEDDNDYKRLMEHESATPMILRDLEKYATIKILTPTVYKDWYAEGVL